MDLSTNNVGTKSKKNLKRNKSFYIEKNKHRKDT